MIYTSVGLPNTCSICGKPQKKKWHAEHEDAARSGQGRCARCNKQAGQQPSAPKVEAPAIEESSDEATAPAEETETPALDT